VRLVRLSLRHMTGRRRRLLIALAVVAALVGATVVSAAAYVASVPTPGPLVLPETTRVYFSDGRTEMARLGVENRTLLEPGGISEAVKQAAVADVEPDFWSSQQSAIARRVVRWHFDLRGSNASVRMRVAVMAWKLDDQYSKDEILAMYLNALPFGRDAHGVEAAAQAYFGKSADTRSSQQVSVAEAIVLATMIDQTGSEPSQERWTQVRDKMVDLGYLTRAEADALTFPTPTLKPYDPKADNPGLSGPAGLVVNQVLAELARSPQFKGKSWDFIRNGGFKITTTVDRSAQGLLEKTANGAVAGSVMSAQPRTLQAAAAVVEPGTGRVIAYYGGPKGGGADYAGWYIDEDGDATGFGAHRPGTSFQVYALAAALKDGVSLDSRWDSRSPRTFPGRQQPVRNLASCPAPHGVRNGPCTLLGSTLASLDGPYFALTQTIGTAAVLEMAKAAGIADMWDDESKRVSLDATKDMTEVTLSRFGFEMALGQYRVTVLDQANAMATFAAGGVRAKAHFVRQVRMRTGVVYSERLPTAREPTVLSKEQAADLTWALSQGSAGRLRGIDSASKTGTWIDGVVPTHAWMVGYTGRLAAAVWIGSAGREGPLKDGRGAAIFGAGLPATIYRTFMTAAHTDMNLRPGRFGPPAHVGDADRGDAPPA